MSGRRGEAEFEGLPPIEIAKNIEITNDDFSNSDEYYNEGCRLFMTKRTEYNMQFVPAYYALPAIHH